mmetsp:Transcript_109765/g.310548  ORF Transcript_109765/g.310548 Transcript_109765/m.310548 type:complete len:101 (-) Transcript_109765:143-445(-)
MEAPRLMKPTPAWMTMLLSSHKADEAESTQMEMAQRDTPRNPRAKSHTLRPWLRKISVTTDQTIEPRRHPTTRPCQPARDLFVAGASGLGIKVAAADRLV